MNGTRTIAACDESVAAEIKGQFFDKLPKEPSKAAIDVWFASRKLSEAGVKPLDRGLLLIARDRLNALLDDDRSLVGEV